MQFVVFINAIATFARVGSQAVLATQLYDARGVDTSCGVHYARWTASGYQPV
jgi:hypothetical protein